MEITDTVVTKDNSQIEVVDKQNVPDLVKEAEWKFLEIGSANYPPTVETRVKDIAVLIDPKIVWNKLDWEDYGGEGTTILAKGLIEKTPEALNGQFDAVFLVAPTPSLAKEQVSQSLPFVRRGGLFAVVIDKRSDEIKRLGSPMSDIIDRIQERDFELLTEEKKSGYTMRSAEAEEVLSEYTERDVVLRSEFIYGEDTPVELAVARRK